MTRLNRRQLLAAGALVPTLAWREAVSDTVSSSGEDSSHSQAIARAAAALLNAEVPAAVAQRLAWTLLDGIAVIRFGSQLRAVEPFVRSMSDRTGSPSATVPAAGLKVAAENAAAIHAFLIHAAEIDDSDLRGQLRASSVVLPAVLATAEAVDCSGAQFVRAASLAYTIQGRLSTPLQPRGWMSSGVWGPPAAAAAAAFLMEQPASVIASAIGLAAASSTGLFQYYYDQTEDKRIIVARGSRVAVESARLATLGEAGPSRIIEGRAGLYRLFAGIDAPAADLLTRDLAAFEGPLFLRPKFYSASQSIIPTLEGLSQDLPPGFKAEDIESFVVRGDQRFSDTLGEKIHNYQRPATIVGAMLTYDFVVSMFLLRKSVMPYDYPEALADERVHRLASRARYEGGAPMDELTVEFLMRDGRSHHVRARKPGRQEQAPLDQERRLQKFEALSHDLDPSRRKRLLTLCLRVETARSMRRWMRELSTLIQPVSSPSPRSKAVRLYS